MDLSLYLHFPFCVRKCAYCDFLSFPAPEEKRSIYASALIREIRAYAGQAEDCTVRSVFLGGGTPSLMPAGELERIFRALFDSFDIAPGAEITMEVNPGTVDGALLPVLSQYVNRVSIGAQSASETELAALGRIHGFGDVEKTAALVRAAGIGNLNLDLMYGIPGQTARSFEETLRAALSLAPAHISAYSLIVEEGTPFGDRQKAGKLSLPSEEEEREMDRLAGRVLGEAGYRRYEISNYALPGRECVHNLRNWRRGDYIGMGLGASSLLRHVRWRNTRRFDDYCRGSADPSAIVREAERLSVVSEIEEFMFLGLRLTEGVSAEDFRETFRMELQEIYGETIGRLTSEGLLFSEADGSCRLTERGREVSNPVLAEFLIG